LGSADRDAYLWITDHRVGWLDPIFLGLSAVGYAGLVWVGLALVLSLLARRPPLPAVAAVGATVWSVDALVGFTNAVRCPGCCCWLWASRSRGSTSASITRSTCSSERRSASSGR
jgi:hypothetical protein